jgi:hypothetical protein
MATEVALLAEEATANRGTDGATRSGIGGADATK